MGAWVGIAHGIAAVGRREIDFVLANLATWQLNDRCSIFTDLTFPIISYQTKIM